MIKNITEQLILDLHDIGAIKFGKFTLKSGKISPFYLDLRDMISHPGLLKTIAELIAEKVRKLDFDYISGIPYTALPIATLVADQLQKPLIYMRKEEKAYGTKNPIIGQYEKGKTCLIIDDLITTGESIIETAEKFEKSGLITKDFAVIIDRSIKGQNALEQHDFNLHSLFDLNDIINVLQRHQKIDAAIVSEIENFTNQTNQVVNKLLTNSVTEKINRLINYKKSRLVLSLDVDNQKDFFDILDQTAEHIVLLKTHIDILQDFDPNFITKLQSYAQQFNFMIFEDRKFADIGNTVKKQYQGGIYRIADWSEVITVHGVPGEGILDGLFDGITGKSSFLLAKMSSKANLMNETYTRKILEMGRKHHQVVSGYIGHGNTAEEIKRLKNKIPAGQLLAMPGVKLEKGSDSLGQQYTSVAEAIAGGADLIIVGRGIIAGNNPKETAIQYQKASYQS